MNIHPLIVHFPIALIIVGTLCDAIGILGHRDFFQKTGYLLFATGAVSALVAAYTGENAARVAQHITGIAHDLHRHDNFGTAAAWLSVALTLGRTHLSFKKQFTGVLRAVYLALALVAVGLVGAAGYTGGHLVYDHGAGTEPVIETLHLSPNVPAQTPRINSFESAH